jgi:hypothetical protein
VAESEDRSFLPSSSAEIGEWIQRKDEMVISR